DQERAERRDAGERERPTHPRPTPVCLARALLRAGLTRTCRGERGGSRGGGGAHEDGRSHEGERRVRYVVGNSAGTHLGEGFRVVKKWGRTISRENTRFRDALDV